MEIVKLVQNQKPTKLAQLKADLYHDGVFQELALAERANAAPLTPTGSAPVRDAPLSLWQPPEI